MDPQVKPGSGKLTLAAANSYFGVTTVSNGTLFINGDNTAE
jgi:autotransporter-associated beta strand protein